MSCSSGLNTSFGNSTSGGANGDIPTVNTYNDLPIGLSAPNDRSMYQVTTTSAAGIYTYIALMNVIHPTLATEVSYNVGMWLPADLVARNMSYVSDTNGNPARASFRIGLDSRATLEARGWSFFESGVSAITVEGDHLLIDSIGIEAIDSAAIQFIPVYSSKKKYLLVVENNVVISGGHHLSSGMEIRGDSKRFFISTNGNLIADRFSFYGNNGINTGEGALDNSTNGARIFVTGVIGGDSAKDSSQWLGWEANIGSKLNKTFGASVKEFINSMGTKFQIFARSQGVGVRGSTAVYEFHLFEYE